MGALPRTRTQDRDYQGDPCFMVHLGGPCSGPHHVFWGSCAHQNVSTGDHLKGLIYIYLYIFTILSFPKLNNGIDWNAQMFH